MANASPLNKLLADIAGCRICADQPVGRPLPHDPRPVLSVSPTAKIAICGQAPGTRVHASGVPFTDPSGDRLRDWMCVTSDEFYDASRIAIVPMGFCFPGLDTKGGDLPPRKECAPRWRSDVLQQLEEVRLILLIGQYAQRWHLGKSRKPNLTETVRHWQSYIDSDPVLVPLPHPSWRNNALLKKNPWFSAELLPDLQRRVRELM